MRSLLALFTLAAGLHAAEKDDVIAAVQRTFDAMAARDTAAIRAVMLPEAQLYVVAGDGKVRAVPLDAFAKSIGEAKETLLERMWKPRVLIHGRLATLWTQYDFHRGGKFHHCGVDAVHLLKTPDGWKLASIAYTTQTQGCKPSPLGPPRP
jgi:ketosteroid isomerase-like protein